MISLQVTIQATIPSTKESSITTSLCWNKITLFLLHHPLMVGKESYQDSLMDFDEAEETLSLCDLPIYSDATDLDNFSKEDQSSSSSSPHQDDFFEFFSEEWNTSTTAQNIIFCGKLIPYKEPLHVQVQKLETSKQQKPRNRGLFRWNSDSFNQPKTSNKSNGSNFKSLSLPVSEKYKYRAGKSDEKYGFSVQRVSILTSPSKSRSYLCMFGLARYPTEMDLSDMKSRQSRRSPSTMFRSLDGGDEKVAVGRSRGKGLWGLIRAFGCGGSSFEHARTLEMDCPMQKDYAD